jgi:hypothetical protein
MRCPLAVQASPASTATPRRQPLRVVDGHVGVYELIHPSSGDNPDSEVAPRFQRLREPYPPVRDLAPYREHFGLAWPARPALQIHLRARRGG